MDSNYTQPVNLGNPVEHSIKEIAMKIRDQVQGKRNHQSKNHATDVEPALSDIDIPTVFGRYV